MVSIQDRNFVSLRQVDEQWQDANYPEDRERLTEAQAVIFEEKGGVVARIGLSYREPLLDRTVLMLVWSSVDHAAPPTEVPPFNPPYVPNDGEVGP